MSGDRIGAGTLAGVLSVALLPVAFAQPEPRLVRVATDPTQHRLLAVDSRAARDANLISGYAQLVSEQTGMRFQEQPVESTTAALEALCDGRADLMLLLGPLDNAPCTALAASPAYYRGQTLLASRHIHAQPPEFAHLRRVAVVRGSRLSEWLAAYHPHLQVIGLPTLRETLAAVEAGVVDVAMELDVAMRPLARREFGDSLLLHGGPASLPGSLHLVVRHRDRPMLDQIHQAMRSISPQEHAMLMQRWTKATYLSGPSLRVMSRHFQWELLSMGLTLALLLGAGGWMYRAQQSARRSHRQQARFIATMSHEVRNAAQALVTSVDLLHQSALDQGQRQLVNAARSAGAGLRHLLGHALDYSRSATGSYLPLPGWQDMRQLARDCIAVVRPAADAKGLALTLLQQTDPLPRMWFDGDALRQVLANLLGNAIKFTDVGEVEVTVALVPGEDAAQLVVEVRDTGIGIPADQHATVFKPFAQAHDKRSRDLGGAGLGLSICQDLVRGMGGQLQLRSAPGEGSCFEVRLPVVVEGDGQAAREQPLAGRTLLLVEDHALNRTVLARQLEVLGASVTACGDGASALRSQATEPCGIVLLDCVLDDMSGYELAVQLRGMERRHARTPATLVAVSANDSPGHVERCRSCGMDAVLCKPLEVRQLLDVLQLDDSDADSDLDAEQAPAPESFWNRFLQSLQDELMGLNDALRRQAGNRLRHHAHRLSGVLRMLGQSALASIADDLHELDLDDATGWIEAERLLGYLRPAVAELVRGALTSTAADSAATARAPETP
ncbi:ATP-binding protein [uncultured Stenotrophomonas sp.]|uniref:ATP-binding protein n=1 Tax=uncultured Stenotrophomonas sp. TaxID=165438 RepID=UPI0028E3781B|nr:ATP-binding protein [uncultured Stenotrophomonas sp.]